jgi:RNAse (barnase) inhibitor barstar
MSHDSLENYYSTNFAMVNHHGWSLDELEDALSYERQIYVALLRKHLEELEAKRNQWGGSSR